MTFQERPSEAQLRQQLLACARKTAQDGLNRGTSGNCSVRLADGSAFLVTPSGVPVRELSEDSMVRMGFDGNAQSLGKPSSEWRFHRDILVARPELHAVVHAHSVYATTLACLRRELPPFHYMIAAAGGNTVRCAGYALFGTQALSDVALQALRDRKACLLANHGMIALGYDLEAALALAVEVESLCEQYLQALQVGEPVLLSEQEMADVIEQFKGYGRQLPKATTAT
jgi:L-fuculose-phosphate aldolase